MDKEGDVFALRTDHTLNDRIVSGAAWRIFGTNVNYWGLDVADDLVLAVISNGGIWEAPAGTTDSSGHGLWSTAGMEPVTAPDGSIWYLGTSLVDGHGNYAIFRFANGQLARMPGVAIGLAVADGALYSVTSFAQAWSWNGKAWVQQTTALDRSNSGLYFLGVATLDSAGDHGIYHWSSGQLTSVPAKAVALGSASPGFWASMPAIKSGTTTATL